MGKRVLIIGAGIAGLSVASYLQRNGFETEVFESHDKPGGLCTSWTRNGFTFDGCIHWLMGSSPASNMRHIWDELGAGNLTYIEWDVYTVVHLSGGERFTVFTDPERLRTEMLRLGPDDGKVINVIVRNIERVSRIDMPVANEKISGSQWLNLILHLPAAVPVLTYWMRVPIGNIVSRFKSPLLREAFSSLYGEYMRDFPVSGLFMMLGFMAKKSSGYPLGGSLAFARAIESRYLAKGGKIRYGCTVDEIIVEGNSVKGVKAAGGETRGDIVISAADGHDTLARLLGGKWSSPSLDTAYSDFRRFPSLLYISFGFAADYSALPHMQTFPLGRPLVFESGNLVVKSLNLRLFHFDPSTAPAGKTAGIVMIETSNDAYWTNLKARDRSAYQAEKEAVAAGVLGELETRIPGIRTAAETVDVATPATFIRYTNNWHGSYEGFLPTIKTFGKPVKKSIPGLKNFYMVGQWVNPGGGLPPCGIDGRELAKRLCAKEGLSFHPD